ncbi:MAG: LCP family protein [Patescibacteria group bacterium]|nr:LCP family protein [Patescibacteria group bacterium]
MQPSDFPNNNYYENPKPDFPKRRKSRFFFWFMIAAIVLGLAFLTAFALAYKFYSTSRKVITENPPDSFFGSLTDIAFSKKKILRGEENGRINILLLGLAGENYPGENLTDSIIVASVNPKTYQTAMLSVPRDFYVRIPDTNSYTKINALYARGHDRHGKETEGVEDLKSALTEITGLPIHYYVALDFDGFKKVIGELGGVKIQVPKDIHDERYPGPNFSYQTFDIKQGLQTLDGETALKYARTRHDEDGDFGRAYRQQLILESARSKAFSIGTLLDVAAVNNILNILGDHLRTDVGLDELESFLELSEKIDTHLTINKVLDAGQPDSLTAVSHVFLGRVRAFILIPRTGNYDEIQELAKDIFNLDLIERKKKEIENEKAIATIVNRSGSANFGQKLATLLGKMGYDAKIAKSVEVSPRQDSVIFDISKTKPFSLEDMAKKFSAEISQNFSANLSAACANADLCLVAGSDLTDNLDYEEDTVKELESEYEKQQIDEREYIELLKKGSIKKYN